MGSRDYMALELMGATSQERVLRAIEKLRDLPAAVPVVRRALAQLDKPDFIVADIKNVLMSDQALAARVLKLANSAYFGFRSEVQTVSQAVVLLGQRRIRTLLQRILTDKLLMELGHGASAAAPIRRRSLAGATASCMLSQLLVVEDAEEMLLAGLLHNIGDLFFLSRFPEEYARISKGEDATALLGTTASHAGRLLLERWNFPPLYPAVVEHHEQPFSPAAPASQLLPISLVHAGAKIGCAFLAGLGVSEAALAVSPDACELLHLDSELVAEVYQSLPERMSLEQLQAGR